ncbi:MAG: hypothetical protein HGGPFJEG_00616 [Ignavibacteria bacterium]|nr:hypothetical protein [Ignavibacteria bacterium]
MLSYNFLSQVYIKPQLEKGKSLTIMKRPKFSNPNMQTETKSQFNINKMKIALITLIKNQKTKLRKN